MNESRRDTIKAPLDSRENRPAKESRRNSLRDAKVIVQKSIRDGFKARFRECILRKGSVYALSKASSVPIQTLQRYQRGSVPSLTTLVALADAADVTVQWLATGSNQMGRKLGGLKNDLPKLQAAIERFVDQAYDRVEIP